MRKSPANNRPVRKTRHPEDLSKYVYTNEKELAYIRYKSRIICTRRFFSLQQSGEEGRWFKFTTVLCLCYVYMFSCVYALRLICTRRPVPCTRVCLKLLLRSRRTSIARVISSRVMRFFPVSIYGFIMNGDVTCDCNRSYICKQRHNDDRHLKGTHRYSIL